MKEFHKRSVALQCTYGHWWLTPATPRHSWEHIPGVQQIVSPELPVRTCTIMGADNAPKWGQNVEYLSKSTDPYDNDKHKQIFDIPFVA